MPTYQYACTEQSCGHRFEAVQAFSDDPLTTCPQCQGRLRKVFSPVGVVFKGSGFYRTDSRADSKASSNGSSGGDSGTKAKGEDSSSGSSSTSSSSSSEKSTSSAAAATSGS